MRLKISILVLNILLFIAMVVHVGIKMYWHSQHPEFSIPAYAEIINVVYYIVPFILINVVYLVVRKKYHSGNRPKGE